MCNVRFKPYLKQRIRLRIGRSGLNYFLYAFLVWSGWAIAATILVISFGGEGLVFAVLLLGAIVFLSQAYVARWLRIVLTQERRWEAQQHEEMVWNLNDLVRPRRPWPLRQNYMADTMLLTCLWHLIIEKRPKRIVELGSGFSSLVMAYALEAVGQGELVSLEDNWGYAARSRRQLEEHGLSALANVIDSPLKRYTVDGQVHFWYSMSDLFVDLPIDFLFVDGPAGHLHPNVRHPALPLLYDRLAGDAVIVVDDSGRSGEGSMIRRWLATYPNLRLDEELSGERFTVLSLCRHSAKANRSESRAEVIPQTM